MVKNGSEKRKDDEKEKDEEGQVDKAEKERNNRASRVESERGGVRKRERDREREPESCKWQPPRVACASAESAAAGVVVDRCV